MNTWFLVAALLIALAFGYRFYAKLLALDIFRLDRNYSTPAHSRADGRDYVPTHPHLLFGHQVAAVGGALLFAGPIAAVAWGWIPVFLWITVGSAVAAGTYGLGSFWLSLRFSKGIRHLASDLMGRRARFALFFLALAALVCLIAISAGLGAATLAAYPAAALPFVAVALVAFALGTFLHGRAESELLPASITAFAACVLLLWVLSGLPLAFNGALVMTVADTPLVSIDAVFVWVVLLLAYSFHAARLPIWKLTRPRGFLTSLLLAAVLVIFYIALAVEHPALVAPEFHSRAMPSALPWLFLIVGPGALAGWQLLIIHHVTAREMRRETDARYVGYGTALIHAFVALSALIIGATGFSDTEQWSAYYANAPGAADFPRFISSYIDGFGRYAAALQIDAPFARHLAATVVAGLALAVLEASVRGLKHLLAETTPAAPPGRSFQGERGRLWMSVLAGGVLALSDGRGLAGLAAWPFLALVSLWLAAAGFALIAFALRATNRSALLVGALAVGLTVLAAWGSVAQLWAWWKTGDWIPFGAGIAAVLLAAAIARDTLRALRRYGPKPASA